MMLYYMDVSELDFNKSGALVSVERLKKANKFFHFKDKRLSLGVEILLNYALAKIGIFDPVFETDEYDKPYLKNYPDIYFNLSHSEKYVACAVSDSPVGVDIEYIHDIDLNLAKHYFFGSELDYVLKDNLNNSSKEAFFELWVLKESYMKMTGLGFRLGLDEFCIEIDDEIKLNKVIGQNGVNSCGLGLWNVAGGEYMLGVCSKNDAKNNIDETMFNEPILINLDDILILDNTGNFNIKYETMRSCNFSE